MAAFKTVLIDLDRLKSLYTGLGQFALFFGKYLSKLSIPDIHFTFLVPKNFVGYFGNTVSYELADWKRRFFPRFLRSYDLWHAIHQDSNFYPNFSKSKYVITIHDLNFLKEKSTLKAYFRLKKLQKKVDKSVAVCTISEYTKSLVVQHLHVNVPIHVIYNGIELLPDSSEFLHNNRFHSLYADKKILLGIGVIQPKKNWHTVVKMMRFLPDHYLLIIAGEAHSDYARYLNELIQENKLSNKVALIGTVNNDEKCYLLSRCWAFVFPSKLEGMGMPPLEAMKFGKPVFVFPYSSIPEFCKHYTFYWQSENSKDMAEFLLVKLQTFYQNPKLFSEMKDYVNRFTWEKTVQQYLSVYQTLLA